MPGPEEVPTGRADFTSGREREKERPRDGPGTEDSLCTAQILREAAAGEG